MEQNIEQRPAELRGASCKLRAFMHYAKAMLDKANAGNWEGIQDPFKRVRRGSEGRLLANDSGVYTEILLGADQNGDWSSVSECDLIVINNHILRLSLDIHRLIAKRERVDVIKETTEGVAAGALNTKG
ncbi:hypothetical protein Tco_0150134 [Tanacetum coccineum]